MDSRLENKMNEKINEVFSSLTELNSIVESLENLSTNNKSFVYGIVIGRLYNSFYYQCRRILKRSPTPDEFSEFILVLKNRESEFLEKITLK